MKDNLCLNTLNNNMVYMIKRNNGRFVKGQHWRPKKPYWNREWLYNAYVVEGRSSSEIASEFGCIDANILYFLRKHRIKRRNISEARKLKYWGLSGVDNPMFNKKGELNPNWRGGLTPERQDFYASLKWKRVCSAVWKRDKGKCRRCGIKKTHGIPFHIHHIITFQNRKLRADINNLVLLCEVCHQMVHSKKNKDSEFIG